MKKLLTLALSVVMFCLFAVQTQAQTQTAVLTSTTEHTWSAPATGTWRVTKIEVWGGGGGGASATNARTVGSGGGSGAYAAYTTPFIMTAEPLYFQVGAGGAAGARGETTYVKLNANSTDYLARATGGYGGNSAQIAGTGSSSTSSANANTSRAQALDGTTKTQGNTGGNGSISRTRSGNIFNYTYTFSGKSGIGGANVNGEAGGAEVSLNNNQASSGNTSNNAGTGGSGALNTKTSNDNSAVGGSGANGQVIITYERLMNIRLDYNDGATPKDSFYVTLNQTYGNNLPDLSNTREHYIFVGWFNGNTQVYSTTSHTTTDDITLVAHWAYAGAITTATFPLAAPCGDYTVSEATPHGYDGTVIYSWKYTVNGGAEQSLDVDKKELTQADFSQLNQMGGQYVFTRYVTAENQTVASEGTYTITVPSLSSAGEISTADIFICTNAEFTINSVSEATTDYNIEPTYSWICTKVGGSESTIDMNSPSYTTKLLEDGIYVFKRCATLGCAVPDTSAGSYRLVVKNLSSYTPPTITANFTELCEGGKIEIESANYELPDVDQNNNYPTFRWMISEDGGSNFSPLQGFYGKKLDLVINNDGDYSFYLDLTYFGNSQCVISTAKANLKVWDDPTIGAPTINTTTPICPNSEVTMTAGTIQGGVGSYTYTWEFLPAGGDVDNDWVDTAATQATYSSNADGDEITAGNFLVTGDVKYRTKISNAQGCDYTSVPAALSIKELPIPTVSQAMDVCPAPGDTAFTTMVTTTDPSYELRWFANATSTTSIEAPTTSLVNEDVFTYYVAQYNPTDGCLGARVPVTLTITYTAHLGHDNGNLDQTVCQYGDIENVTFSHSGDCAPQVTFKKDGQDINQIAGVTVTTANGITTIAGAPEEAGTFTYHVELHPDAQTVCAAPNDFDGTILVNPVYNVTVDTTICSGSVTISDNNSHSYTFNESGSYTKTLEAVTGCDSVVTVNLYVHEWNQFGFEDNENLIAGWTSFSSVNSPINADVTGSVSGSQITYSGWNGSNSNSQGNLSPSTSSMITAGGSSLGLINHNSRDLNNGKSIVLKTNTTGYGNLKLHFDYGAQRTYAWLTYSDNDKAFTSIKFYYSLDGTNWTAFTQQGLTVQLEQAEVTYGSHDVNISNLSGYNADNAQNLYIKFEFDGAAVSTGIRTNYFLLDNICISGTKVIDELEISREDETKPCCTNQPLTLMATEPYTNTNVEPAVQTPIIYKWERIVGGVSTVLDETSYVLIDNDVQEGDYQYVVSVGEAPCGKSDTLNVHGIKPAYRLDIVRHGTVCSNEVDKVSNITFTDDCQYVDGMFIVTPTADEMRTPGTYTCQLSIPTTENPCDSVITLELEVLKAFDTTVVANICLGETYVLKDPNTGGIVFNITPTVEGTIYETNASTRLLNGCDSIWHLTLTTSSVRQALTPESNVILAAWPMDNGITNFKPTCGKRTIGSSFSVTGVSTDPEHASDITNVSGHAPSSDYCYTTGSNNGAVCMPNLWSDCSGLLGSEKYANFSGTYFEIKLNPYDHNNLRLMFDYKRENASTSNAQAFNQVRYSYKFSETGNYTVLGTANLNSTDWTSQTINFSGANNNIIDQEVVYLKLEFIGGDRGNTESCGWVNGSKYLPSYITIDNVMVLADRPVRAQLDGAAQTCDQTYVCEGSDVTFSCQGDDNYFKFYVVDETAGDTTAFDGNPTLVKTPTETSTYKIVAVEQSTMCDSIWGPFNVEVVKAPTINITQGEYELGICGHDAVNNVILVENATNSTFTWLTDHEGLTETKTTGNNVDTIKITGTMSDGGYAGYRIVADPDTRCANSTVKQEGSITVRKVPTFTHTPDKDTVCQGTNMEFVVDTTGCNFFQINMDERIKWYTQNATLGIKDTLKYEADEAIHSARHYLMVNQNGCTTVDSIDIVVFKFEADTLRLKRSHYMLNYGENYLPVDSLELPDLMHNGEPVAESMIQSIAPRDVQNGIIPVTGMNELTATIMWDIVDVCGNTHSRQQILTFELPPCGDEDHFYATDVDGNEYHTVRMGWNCWMRENLKTLNNPDGTPVAKAMGYVNNEFTDADNTAAIFGRLYTWYSAMGIPEGSDQTPTLNEFGHVPGICPDGWFMPAPEHYYTMREVDMDALRTAEYWLDGGGNNSTKFSILPAGAYNSDNGRFENILGNAYFWTADLSGGTQPTTFMADCNCYMWQVLNSSPNNGFSVRCVKEKIKKD